jgi:hypothetical protein
MDIVLVWLGRVAGIAGLGVCAGAVALRATGHWHVGSFAVGTLLQLGMAGMILACLAYCAALVERRTGEPG